MEIPPEQNAGRILQVGGSLLLSNSKFYKTYFLQIKPDVFPKCISYESEKLMISLVFYQILTEVLLKQLICKTVMPSSQYKRWPFDPMIFSHLLRYFNIRLQISVEKEEF